jgi:FeS assembly protein IscX
MQLKWTDVDQIAEHLKERFPEVDPLYVRFTDLHRWIRELPGFLDDPSRSNEAILEAIQMAWLEKKGVNKGTE